MRIGLGVIGDAASVPMAASAGSTPVGLNILTNPGGIAFVAANVVGFWLLPGWWKLFVLPVTVGAALVIGNWPLCSHIQAEYLACPGQPGPMGTTVYVSGDPNCKSVSPDAKASPQFSCLLNPFPGGL